MNQEDMANELERILKILEKLDPSSEQYSTAVKNYHELQKALHEELEACDADLDHRLKRELDKARQELNEKESKERSKQVKIDAILGLTKIGLSVAGTLAAIALTGSLEESTILSAKCLSWIKGISPRI